MTFNLFIAYDLMKPGQDYTSVHNKIKSLGRWYQPQFSLFYVNTNLTPQQAHAAVWSVMDATDRLAVIDARSGVLSPSIQADIDAINRVWLSNAA